MRDCRFPRRRFAVSNSARTNAGCTTALIDRLSGLVLVATAVLVFLAETVGGSTYSLAAGAAVVLYLALVTPGVHWSRQVFVATGGKSVV